MNHEKREKNDSLGYHEKLDKILLLLDLRRDGSISSVDHGLTPEKLPDPFLIDSEHFLQELARIRALALSVPLTPQSYGPTNTIVDALWRLEEHLRYLLHLHREAQRSFAQKHALHNLSKSSTVSLGVTASKPSRASRSEARRA